MVSCLMSFNSKYDEWGRRGTGMKGNSTCKLNTCVVFSKQSEDDRECQLPIRVDPSKLSDCAYHVCHQTCQTHLPVFKFPVADAIRLFVFADDVGLHV